MPDAYVFEHVLTPDGWLSPGRIEIDDKGTIVSVAASGSEPGALAPIKGFTIPGLANLHSHAFQRAMAGLTEHRGSTADSFWTWRETMYRFVARVTPDGLQAIAAQLYLEMLKAGYTAVCEFHYLHHAPDGAPYKNRAAMSEAICSAAHCTGIGLTHLPVLYAASGFGGKAVEEGQRRFFNSVDGLFQIIGALPKQDAQFRTGLALHSLRAVPPSLLTEAIDELARIDVDAPVHIHIAEQRREVEDCLAWSDQRPVDWLLDAAEVDERWCLVHATHLSEGEVGRIAQSGAVVGLCPTTEANLGDGLFPLRAYLDLEGRIGVGSDSHVSTSPVEELRWLEYGQRLISGERNVAGAPDASTGEVLYEAAAAGGAQAAGQPIGSLAVGKRADLLVLDAAHPVLAGVGPAHALDAYVFSGNANPVRDVMVGGRWIVQDGHVDGEDEIATAYRQTVARLVDTL